MRAGKAIYQVNICRRCDNCLGQGSRGTMVFDAFFSRAPTSSRAARCNPDGLRLNGGNDRTCALASAFLRGIYTRQSDADPQGIRKSLPNIVQIGREQIRAHATHICTSAFVSAGFKRLRIPEPAAGDYALRSGFDSEGVRGRWAYPF